MKKKVEIKKTMTIEEVLTIKPNSEEILLGFGMHCLGCPCSRAESIEDACMVHGINVDELVAQLNK